jgi:structural maintenance of chromosome 4
VETILPHLDYFIVDSVPQARELLEYLKQRKLGRMTVLIRQSIREAIKDLRLPASVPKDTKLLCEVCKCTDQEAKGILMWSLGSTLVTGKLETAMKVAYYDEKRYRVITTNGEFIDSSGTMTKLPLKNGR